MRRRPFCRALSRSKRCRTLAPGVPWWATSAAPSAGPTSSTARVRPSPVRTSWRRSSVTGRSAAGLLVVELVLVALAGPRLRAEAALEAARPDARRRAAGLRVAGAAAVGGPGPVPVATGLDALRLALLLGEVRRPG